MTIFLGLIKTLIDQLQYECCIEDKESEYKDTQRIKDETMLLDEMPVYRNKMYTNLNPTIKIWVWEAICGDKK